MNKRTFTQEEYDQERRAVIQESQYKKKYKECLINTRKELYNIIEDDVTHYLTAVHCKSLINYINEVLEFRM